MSGAYGDPTDTGSGAYRLLQTLQSQPEYGNLVASGAINPTASANNPANVSAQGVVNNVDWSKLPTMGPAGFKLPTNMMWESIGGTAGTTATPGQAIYHDANYGDIGLRQQRAPNDATMNIMRSMAMTAAMGPMAAALAPAAAGALGLSSGGFGQTAIASLIRGLPGLIQGGGGNILSMLGSMAGGASGVPLGSTLGRLAGSYAQSAIAPKAAVTSQQKAQLMMQSNPSTLPRK